MSVTLTYRYLGDVVVVDVVGKIIIGDSAVMLQDGIRELIGRGEKKLVLNMVGVTRIDRYSVGELMFGLITASSNNGGFKLLNLTRQPKDLLQIMRLYDIFEIFENEAEAVASFD